MQESYKGIEKVEKDYNPACCCAFTKSFIFFKKHAFPCYETPALVFIKLKNVKT